MRGRGRDAATQVVRDVRTYDLNYGILPQAGASQGENPASNTKR